MTEFTLSDLERIVAERASVTDGSSYTASLVAKGQSRAAKKAWRGSRGNGHRRH
jgi:phosphoribosyl-ATP pyrophosphohydrolase